MKLQPKEIKKIGVFRALQLGDLLCSVPGLRSLRAGYPDAEIVLIGLPWAANFVTRFSDYLDRFIHFPGYPGLPEQEFNQERFDAFVNQMREEEFDLLLQMQGNGTIVNQLLSGLGARHLAGFHTHECRMSNGLFINYPETIHEAKRHLKLMEHLELPGLGSALEFPITSEDVAELSKLNLPEPYSYVCVHPGSRGSWRQWPTTHFAMFADILYEWGYEVLITGTEAEREIVEETGFYMKHPYINMCGKTGLGAMAKLISDAAMIVSNCTGVSHIASAVKTPGLIISMDGEPFRWAPMNHSIHKTIDWLKVPDMDNALFVFYTLLKKVSEMRLIRGTNVD